MAAEKPILTVSRAALLDDGSDVRFRSLLYNFFAFGSSLEALRARFADKIGLSPTQYLTLIAIAQASQREPAGVADIARRLRLSGAFVTIEVNKLVTAKLVRKESHPTDRRRVQLTISPTGMERLRRLAELQRPVNDALFSSLSAEDFGRLVDIMGRLAVGADSAVALADHLRGRQETVQRRVRSSA